MTLVNDYRPDDVWTYCDICGFKYYRSEMRLNWKHQIVCKKCYEPKHPSLDRKPLPKESGAVRNARPAPEVHYLEYDTVNDEEEITPNDL